jgi:DNA polymerase III epsilon subunit-like protein
MEVYFSVDVEANGPIPGEYSMTSIGAAAGDREFYAELRPISDKFEPEAVKVTGHTLEYLRDKEDPTVAMKRFDRWVRDTAGKGRPVFVAFNATFDWMFVYWYLIRYVGSSPFSISGLDLKAYYMGMMDSTWGGTVKREVRKKFPADLPHTHNALDDAREQAQLFEAMRAYNRERHGSRGRS